MYIHIHTLLFKRPYLQRVFQLSTFVHLILIRGLSAKIKDLWPVLRLHKGKVSFVFISAFCSRPLANTFRYKRDWSDHFGTCHYLAGGGGEGHYFGGEGHNFFPLVWGKVTIFFQDFLGEGHNFFEVFLLRK